MEICENLYMSSQYFLIQNRAFTSSAWYVHRTKMGPNRFHVWMSCDGSIHVAVVVLVLQTTTKENKLLI